MKKSAVKILIISLMITLLITTFSSSVNAIKFGDVTESTVTQGAEDTSGAASSINNIVKAIITIVQVVGVGVAVIMLIVLAIKYISAAPGDKADIKKSAFVYVVGAIVLFAASSILGIIRNFASNVSPS